MASTSRWRNELLARLDLPFRSVAPPYDERAQDHRFAELGPHAFALHLARGKAHSIATSEAQHASREGTAKRERDAEGSPWVLAADQLAVLDEPDGPCILHKPGTEARALEQLLRLRGRTHRLITAVVLVRGELEHHEIDEQRLSMRAFDPAEAQAYVARHQPIHSAGSYHIEDAGIRLFERLEGGDMTSIMGLPLLAVCRLLRAAKLLPS